MKIFNHTKQFLKKNKHFILTGSLFTLSILLLLGIFIYLKHIKSSKSASAGQLNSSSLENYSSKTTFSETSTTSDSTENSSLSDLDFTVPEDVTEETQTTLSVEKYPYQIKVNRILNCVTIYTKDKSGNFSTPYKSMACSTGKYISNTPLGTFHTSSKYPWRLMVDGTQSQFAYRVYGGILFHSVPCYSAKKDQLEVEEFNKLGQPASLGCIRLTVADAKWIYDNCPYGTTVVIYDDPVSPGPLGKPEIIKIPLDSPNAGWDPTDPDPNNPWNSCTPSISVTDITIPLNSNINILNYVTAKDTCGNDITSKVTMTGSINKGQAGSYSVTFHVTDLLGRSDEKTINVNVVTQNSTSATDSSTGSTVSTESNTTPTKNNNPTESTTTRPIQNTTTANNNSSITDKIEETETTSPY